MSSNRVAALSGEDIGRIIQMAWEDRTAFDTITTQFGVSEAEVIQLMRKGMQRSSFELWRRRVSGRKTKHLALRQDGIVRFKSSDQKGY
ncbi:TIGR03643 family protein [Actimicrobium sp. GrIS 1.19]|uniref:TIGR03643 family protein n=1 Tax=Actimicrobium sp. GrIS 1.19 TaxID=3071708 RepID=UPI002E150956